MKGIIWYLSGEYGSFRPFGTTSILETTLFPSKTAIVGMIGAACGWNEKELVGYYERIKIGIKITSVESTFNELMRIWKVEGSKKQEKWLYLSEGKEYSFEKLRSKVLPNIREIYVVIKKFLYKPKFEVFLTTPEDDALIKRIDSALNDPIYPITLGDSDSLFYPHNKNYTQILEIRQTKARRFKCLLDKELVYSKGKGINITGSTDLILFPTQVSMTLSFENERKSPKFKEVLCFIGEIELKKEVDGVYEFNGEPIYLF